MAQGRVLSVVLAGGSGTRLWPFSRQMFPKQFMSFDGKHSLLQATIARLDPLVKKEDVWVVTSPVLATGAGYKDLQGLNYIVEPVARNTAPAIGAMAAYAADFMDDPVLVILPADHLIRDVAAFHDALNVAVDAAEADPVIVTFGIQPTHPETGFGYIKAEGMGNVLNVQAFVEKPDLETARGYLLSGSYTWNSGMFVAKASILLAALDVHAPDVAGVLAEMRAMWKDGVSLPEAMNACFPRMPNVSIDYAVMEKAPNVRVVPCSIGWSDIGSWDAVYDMGDKDADGNVVMAPVLSLDSQNSLFMGKDRVIAAIGVSNLCVVDTPDALLVCDRGQTQKVKNIVDRLKELGGETHICHRTVDRPWGRYTVLEDAETGYKIKRIEVVPGGRLSLQSHAHRSEHWVVVSGVATVTNGDAILTLGMGESTFIPQGHKHRLENLGVTPVQIVEVQVGTYLGEDDIVRYDDVYGRG